MARLVMGDGERVTVGGSMQVIGASGAQSVSILKGSGSVVFDASFNAGGDTVLFDQPLSAFLARVSGSSVILSDGDTQITIPVGTKGIGLQFSNGTQQLIYDTTAGRVKLGDVALESGFTALQSPYGSATFAANAPTGEVAGTRIAFREVPVEDQIKSGDSGQAVTFNLTNKTSTALTLFWIDRTGTLIKFADIGIDQTWKQGTFSGHPWLVRDAVGKDLVKFFPGQGSAEVSSTGFKVTALDAEQNAVAKFGSWNSYQGYGVINVAKALDLDPSGVNLPDGKNNHNSLELIDAPAAWLAGITGASVKVAVVDSGIAANPEIGAFAADKDFFDGDANGTPDAGSYRDHSLSVAAIVSAAKDYPKIEDTTGVAPDSLIMNVRVGGNEGSPINNIMAGIKWAADNGAKVIIVPLQNSAPFADQEIIDAVEYAYSKNAVTVLIGGNFSIYGASGLALAAKSGHAIAVGNFDAAASKLFQSSNQAGGEPWNWVVASSTGYYPNAEGGYTFSNDGGTSYAGPYVAGLAALLFQQNPNWTAQQVIDRIVMTSSNTYVENVGALQMQGGAGSDSFVGSINDDWLKGGDGDDYLEGYAGNDRLEGGAGNDTLYGGTGSDVLTGGAGADRFLFSKALDIGGVDVISDFAPQEDKIVLNKNVFSTLQGGSLKAAEFLFGAGATSNMTNESRIVYDTLSAGLYYDADGSGPLQPTLFALLVGKPSIDANSFIVI